jgi:hypothetical protein
MLLFCYEYEAAVAEKPAIPMNVASADPWLASACSGYNWMRSPESLSLIKEGLHV